MNQTDRRKDAPGQGCPSYWNSAMYEFLIPFAVSVLWAVFCLLCEPGVK